MREAIGSIFAPFVPFVFTHPNTIFLLVRFYWTLRKLGASRAGMNKETFFKHLGTVSQFLAMVAMVPYTSGDLALIFPPEWKTVILKVALIAYLIGRFLAAQFKVPFNAQPPGWGDDKPSPANPPAAKPGGARVRLIAFLLIPFLGGCMIHSVIHATTATVTLSPTTTLRVQGLPLSMP